MEIKKEIEILTKASNKLYELKAIRDVSLDKHYKKLEEIDISTLSGETKEFYKSRVEYLINLDKRNLAELEVILNDIEGLIRELYSK